MFEDAPYATSGARRQYQLSDEPAPPPRRIGTAIGLASTMEPCSQSCSRLYARLLGNSWSSLDDTVKRLHALSTAVHAAGVFRVRHGNNWLARALAWLARLPQAGEAVDIQLLVTARPDGEEWRRSFAGRPLVSLQSGRPDGLLAERMGILEMRFRLQVASGSLIYESTGAALCMGQIRIPLPKWLGPHVGAVESPAADGDQIEVAVEVRLPLLGQLITYGGKLTRVEAEA